MILVDTSIWIDHLNRGGVPHLAEMIDKEDAAIHRYVIGEIALGSLKDRAQQLGFLKDLHKVPVATDAEVSALIEWGQLHGTGIGYVDAHLLTAVRATSPRNPVSLWTRDKRLRAQAERLGVAADLD